MFRLSNLLSSALNNKPFQTLNGAIAIWNFTNRCNLECLHCYSRASLDAKDTLSTKDILTTLPKLKENGVKFIIFSGGEPLTRSDIFEVAKECKALGIMTYLSSNGLYIHTQNVQKILEHFNYIGISIDGSKETHDFFRGQKGAFELSLKAIKLLQSYQANKIGIRFTLTKDTLKDLPFIFKLAQDENITKIYISHLVYSGRGLDNLKMDLDKKERREALDFIIEKAFYYYEKNIPIEIVTGNMEEDAIYFLKAFSKRYPKKNEELIKRLKAWGGNSAGRKLLNIDANGNVKPDPFFPFTLGNILQEDFGAIWQNKDNEMLQKLREFPRKIEGKCKTCYFLDICNGGSRSRAYALFGNLWAEDPSCYLTKEEREGAFL